MSGIPDRVQRRIQPAKSAKKWMSGIPRESGSLDSPACGKREKVDAPNPDLMTSFGYQRSCKLGGRRDTWKPFISVPSSAPVALVKLNITEVRGIEFSTARPVAVYESDRHDCPNQANLTTLVDLRAAQRTGADRPRAGDRRRAGLAGPQRANPARQWRRSGKLGATFAMTGNGATRILLLGGTPWAPRWLVDLIGVDFFGHVTDAVCYSGAQPMRGL